MHHKSAACGREGGAASGAAVPLRRAGRRAVVNLTWYNDKLVLAHRYRLRRQRLRREMEGAVNQARRMVRRGHRRRRKAWQKKKARAEICGGVTAALSRGAIEPCGVSLFCLCDIILSVVFQIH